MTRFAAVVFAVSTVLGAAAPAAASLADPGARPAVVNLDIDARIEGRRAMCLAKLLVPRSATTDEYVSRNFGNAERGVRRLNQVELQQARYGDSLYASTRDQARCRFDGDFKQVAPGEYYALALTSALDGPTEAYGNYPSTGAILMRRVTVLPGSRLRVSLED